MLTLEINIIDNFFISVQKHLVLKYNYKVIILHYLVNILISNDITKFFVFIPNKVSINHIGFYKFRNRVFNVLSIKSKFLANCEVL